MSVLLMLLLVIVGAAGMVGTLLILGDGKLFGGTKTVQARQKDDEDHTGKVAVPISVRRIEAYTTVQTEDLIDPKIKDFAVRWVDPEQAKAKGFLTDLTALRGRVTARDKQPGFAFTETDLMPKGTRPGPGSAIEPGMRGVWIDPEQAEGFEALGRGDRFDLVATMKVQVKSGGQGDPRFTQPPDAKRAQAERDAWDTTRRTLVKNGKIIVPLAADLQKRKGKKVFVQVAETEAAELMDALAVGAELAVFIRSSQPGAGDTDLPEPQRPAPVETIEVIQGGKSVTVPVAPGGGQQEPK